MTQPRRIGYAHCAASKAHQAAQHAKLEAAGCHEIYLDAGLAPAEPDLPQRAQALARCQVGDTLVVPALELVFTSDDDARRLCDELGRRHVQLDVDGDLYTADELLALVPGLTFAAKLHSGLRKLASRIGVDVARQHGRAPGGQYALSSEKLRQFFADADTGDYTQLALADRYGISPRTVSRYLNGRTP